MTSRVLLPVAEAAARWPSSPHLVASLAGLMSVVFAEIGNSSRGFVVTVLAFLEEIRVVFVIKGNISVFCREYHGIRSLDDGYVNHQNNQQGYGPFHDESPLAVS